MFRSHLLALTLSLIGAMSPLRAPVPKDADKDLLYYPTIQGTKLVYSSGKSERVVIVMSVEEKNGCKVVATGYESSGTVKPHQVVSVSEKGVSVVDTDVADLDEPFWLLKLPHKDKNEWDAVLAPSGFKKSAGKMKAFGPEKVEVPAGTFRAIRVEMDMTFAGERQRLTTWYAPQIGQVKEVIGDRVEVLKSFTVGKK